MDITTVLSDKNQTVDNKVKIAILYNTGDNNPDPTTIDGSKSLGSFGFDDQGYIDLAELFNDIVKALNSSADDISADDIKSKSTVQDCIDLVNTTIKPGTAK
jgi:hypothetical protein